MTRLAEQAAREEDERAKTEALIIEAYGQNQSLREIAGAARLSHEQVRRILTKHQVPIRARGRAAQTDPPESSES